MTRHQFLQLYAQIMTQNVLLSGLLLQARQKNPVSDDAAFAHAKATYLKIAQALEEPAEFSA